MSIKENSEVIIIKYVNYCDVWNHWRLNLESPQCGATWEVFVGYKEEPPIINMGSKSAFWERVKAGVKFLVSDKNKATAINLIAEIRDHVRELETPEYSEI